MFQVKTPALVLDKEPGYRDEGEILLFTKLFGILKVTATGVCRPGASLSAWTEPPASVVAEIALPENHSGYGRLFTLSLENYFPYIRSSYQSLNWFYFYCFLLTNFLPRGVKSDKSYRLLGNVLKFEDSWKNDSWRDLNFVYFLVQLLKVEGLCSSFSHCVSCQERFQDIETTYYSLSEQGLLCKNCSVRTARDNNKKFFSDTISLDFLRLLPQIKPLNLPKGLLRINPEERMVLEIQEKSEQIEQAFANIFSRPKINDQTFAKVRNFLLIFLAPLL